MAFFELKSVLLFIFFLRQELFMLCYALPLGKQKLIVTFTRTTEWHNSVVHGTTVTVVLVSL